MKINITKVISEGLSFGKTLIINDLKVNKYNITDINLEKERLINIINLAISKLEEFNDEYFLIQKLMLQDKYLLDKAKSNIENNLINAEYALDLVLEDIIVQLKQSNSVYMNERIYDILDLKNNLLNIEEDLSFNEKKILVINELTPSYLIKHKDNILGIISKNAGYMSHGAILARSYGIPYVLVDEFNFLNTDNLCIDTRSKYIYINEENERANDFVDENFILTKHNNINVCANVFLNEELDRVNSYNFDGVGLYRTEFIFMNKDKALSVEEQINVYKEANKKVGNKFIFFRTFDVGDDKQVSYINTKEKGFNNYLNNLNLFTDQIKALILSSNDILYIMFPMLRAISEFNYLKDLVLKEKKNLKSQVNIKFGIMLETKDAYYNINDFKDVDFISIGTNDLTKELYGISREDSEEKLSLYQEDLTNKLKFIVKFCKENNIYLSICGEIASMSDVTYSLLDIGLTNFSVSVNNSKNLDKSINKYFNEKAM